MQMVEEPQSDCMPGGLVGREALSAIAGRRCAVSWSGGKDACLAMYRSVRAGAKVEVLVNMRGEDGKRSRSHGLKGSVIRAQAQAMGLLLHGAATSWGEYERHFLDTLCGLKDQGIEACIFGDIDLQAHLDWERMVCERVGMIPVLPLWQEGRMELVHEFLEAGFETRIVALRDGMLSPDYLGRILTLELAAEFTALGIDACGENGEFHTVVTDGPLFGRPITILQGERVLRDGYWFLDFVTNSPST